MRRPQAIPLIASALGGILVAAVVLVAQPFGRTVHSRVLARRAGAPSPR